MTCTFRPTLPKLSVNRNKRPKSKSQSAWNKNVSLSIKPTKSKRKSGQFWKIKKVCLSQCALSLADHPSISMRKSKERQEPTHISKAWNDGRSPMVDQSSRKPNSGSFRTIWYVEARKKSKIWARMTLKRSKTRFTSWRVILAPLMSLRNQVMRCQL